MSANVPLNLGLLRMLDRLGGQKSASLPELLNTVQPVAIFTDLSSTITSEIFEPRAITSFTVAPGVGLWGGIELQAATQGGILIERLTVRTTFDDQGVSIAINGFSVFTAGVTTEAAHLDVGGPATQSRGLVNANIAGLPSNAVAIYVVPGSMVDLPVERIYVPPGFNFLLTATTAGVLIFCTLVWRELLDAQGGQ